MNIKLTTHDNGFVADANIPDSSEPPKAIVWGGRVFLYLGKKYNETTKPIDSISKIPVTYIYREYPAYHLSLTHSDAKKGDNA